jgi:hypothetical protein
MDGSVENIAITRSRRIRTLVHAVVRIITVFALSLMTSQSETSVRASWKDQETSALVDFLLTNKAEAGDNGNFKDSTFTKAAVHINNLHLGVPKTSKQCHSKWTSV